MEKLPYAIMCELKKLAGERPSTDFRPIGNRRPTPEAMQMRRGYRRPLSPVILSAEIPNSPTSKYEYSASLQDLVDFSLIKHGYWHEGTTTYGFHLTDKAMQYLRPSPPHQIGDRYGRDEQLAS